MKRQMEEEEADPATLEKIGQLMESQPEITEQLALNLPISAIRSLCSVSYRLSLLCASESFWKAKSLKDGYGDTMVEPTTTWKASYILNHALKNIGAGNVGFVFDDGSFVKRPLEHSPLPDLMYVEWPAHLADVYLYGNVRPVFIAFPSPRYGHVIGRLNGGDLQGIDDREYTFQLSQNGLMGRFEYQDLKAYDAAHPEFIYEGPLSTMTRIELFTLNRPEVWNDFLQRFPQFQPRFAGGNIFNGNALEVDEEDWRFDDLLPYVFGHYFHMDAPWTVMNEDDLELE